MWPESLWYVSTVYWQLDGNGDGNWLSQYYNDIGDPTHWIPIPKLSDLAALDGEPVTEDAMLRLRADLDEATKQHMPAMVVTTDYLRGVLARADRAEAALREARVEIDVAWREVSRLTTRLALEPKP